METTQGYSKGIKVIYSIVIFIAVLSIISWFKGCFGNSDTIVVTHPAVVGKTTIVKPESAVIHDTITIEKKIFGQNLSKADFKKLKAKADSLLNENIKLQVAFAKAKNKDSLYQKAIQINAFNHTWDNDTINAMVNGLSRGTVESIQLHYTIKATKQDVKIPETVFRLLGGAEFGTTKDLSKFNVKANLGLQNRKGNILNIGADTDQRFYLGYSASIFSIKR